MHLFSATALVIGVNRGLGGHFAGANPEMDTKPPVSLHGIAAGAYEVRADDTGVYPHFAR